MSLIRVFDKLLNHLACNDLVNKSLSSSSSCLAEIFLVASIH